MSRTICFVGERPLQYREHYWQCLVEMEDRPNLIKNLETLGVHDVFYMIDPDQGTPKRVFRFGSFKTDIRRISQSDISKYLARKDSAVSGPSTSTSAGPSQPVAGPSRPAGRPAKRLQKTSAKPFPKRKKC